MRVQGSRLRWFAAIPQSHRLPRGAAPIPLVKRGKSASKGFALPSVFQGKPFATSPFARLERATFPQAWEPVLLAAGIPSAKTVRIAILALQIVANVRVETGRAISTRTARSAQRTAGPVKFAVMEFVARKNPAPHAQRIAEHVQSFAVIMFATSLKPAATVQRIVGSARACAIQ